MLIWLGQILLVIAFGLVIYYIDERHKKRHPENPTRNGSSHDVSGITNKSYRE